MPGMDDPTAGQTMQEYVMQEALANGLDPEFVARLVKQESSFNPYALGRVTSTGERARGLMQVMPATGADYGVTNLADPLENVRAGMAHLKRLSKKYGGDQTLMSAAYNAGEGRVDAAGGVPDFPETQDYVKKVARQNPTINPEPVTPEAAPPSNVTDGVNADVNAATKAPELPAAVDLNDPTAGEPLDMSDSTIGEPMPAGDVKKEERKKAFAQKHPGWWERIVAKASHPVQTATDLAAGAAKGALGTVADIGESGANLLSHVGMDPTNALRGAAFAHELAAPTNNVQALGKGIENVAEYAIPASKAAAGMKATTLGRGLITRVGAQALAGGATSAGVAAVKGDNPVVAGLTGAVGGAAAVPVEAAVPFLGKFAQSAMRSAVKTGKQALKDMPGGLYAGLNNQSRTMADYILKNKLTPESVVGFVKQFSDRLEDALASDGHIVVGAVREVEKNLADIAKKYGSAPLTAEIQGVVDKLYTTIPGPAVSKWNGMYDHLGKKIMTMVPGPEIRVPRLDVTAAEALEIAQSMKGMVRGAFGQAGHVGAEAAKGVNRGLRTASKEVQSIADAQEGHGMALTTGRVLDAAANRLGNRNMVDSFSWNHLTSFVNPMSYIKQYMHKHPIEAAHRAMALRSALDSGNKGVIGRTLMEMLDATRKAMPGMLTTAASDSDEK